MKYFKFVALFMIMLMLLFSFSCISSKKYENCKIDKLGDIVIKNDCSYFVKVKFNCCKSKKSRILLVKNALINRFPTIKNNIMQVEEYLGKSIMNICMK